MDEQVLRTKAREALEAGKLPHRRPDRTWGAPGVGAACSVCDLPVQHHQLQLEMEFARGGDRHGPDKYHAHVWCFTAWEFERRRDGH